ncbi:MAG: DUF4442 domain-containing protein [Cryobacterium sp.]|nr:DUF4442 domain-containing protein [Oligoflexia bacterium]
MDFHLVKETWKLRAFGFLKIPLIFFCSPKLIEMTDDAVEMVIPLNYRTKNHLGSMYFGALSIGADIAGGLIAMRLIQKSGNKVSLVFKDFRAEFLKRPEGDVHFRSTDGAKMKQLVDLALATGERENDTVEILATCPSKLGEEIVARLYLTISLKKKTERKSA